MVSTAPTIQIENTSFMDTNLHLGSVNTCDAGKGMKKRRTFLDTLFRTDDKARIFHFSIFRMINERCQRKKGTPLAHTYTLCRCIFSIGGWVKKKPMSCGFRANATPPPSSSFSVAERPRERLSNTEKRISTWKQASSPPRSLLALCWFNEDPFRNISRSSFVRTTKLFINPRGILHRNIVSRIFWRP